MNIFKLLFLLVSFSSLSLLTKAQVSEDYYSNSFGKKKQELKTALKEIIYNHESRSYQQLWTDFQITDNKGSNQIWDMYSDNPSGKEAYVFYFFSDQCGNYSREGDCYNREHSVPSSWFNDASPMYTDLFHLYPTDGYVNNRRGNYPFGEVGNATWTSTNGSKLGKSNFPGYSGTVFEPIDEYKGDFARSYFYMVTCYEDKVPSWNSDMLSKNTYPSFSGWAIDILLKWHRKDPVSEKEINRNNTVYQIQKNRNPFIDYPQLAEYIWGDSITYSFNPHKITPSGIESEPSDPVSVYISKGELKIENFHKGELISIYTIYGQLLSRISTNERTSSVMPPNEKILIIIIIDNSGKTTTYKLINDQ